MKTEEKIKEMLKNGFTKEQILNYRFSNDEIDCYSFDDYLSFLRGVQKIFGPFPVSQKITKTDLNKL